MRSFDIIFFMLAVGGTIGMIGLGIALAQLSFLLFIIFGGLLAGCVVYGFKRKKRLFGEGRYASESQN
ncbi:DUF5325 family protein [Alkalicoccus halolimnae]|uniref:DUF5325 family protein n=1 Tax=Alkalicoccus halolimnae TaxID=1667239 RepID=A0A5C7FM55_9BACI|nr:DUF5325 family protein [Alkalicoccus halolimnae]TXF87464.1 hypothetical protein FTX54_01725 [Alkalicoccus halolimnae]